MRQGSIFAQGEAARGSSQFDKALASAEKLMGMAIEIGKKGPGPA